MKQVQSENLAREWDEDIQAPELWDALQLIKLDTKSGLNKLIKLANDGSAISAMYVGHFYMTGQHGVHLNKDEGIKWLRRSADMGSIEGGYRLAKYMQENDQDRDAIALYRELGNRGYSPANFMLAIEYYLGDVVDKNIEESLVLFRKAEASGHLHAGHWVCHLLMKDGKPLSWIRGALKKISLLFPMVYYYVNHPNSDRLRR